MATARIFPVIMAGGASSRLWPASGAQKPKWDLRLFGNADSARPQSLLEGAWERSRAVAPASDCFVVTGVAQEELVRRSLPELPRENLLVEPEPRDTAGAVAFAAGAVLRASKSGNNLPAVMFILPGDHVISPVTRFTECALAGARAAVEHDALVTFGIVPRSPATAYGYIHRAENIAQAGAAAQAPRLYAVKEFREKPDLATAQAYVASGNYLWNGGIFLWQASTLMREFSRQLPEHEALAKRLAESAALAPVIAQHFPALKKTSIDFGIMEKAQKVLTVAADFNWDDIGSWSAVKDHLPAEGGNALGPGTRLLNVDAKGNLVFAPGKRVALIGVEGLAVIESDGEILVCRLDRDQEVKKISEAAKQGGNARG